MWRIIVVTSGYDVGVAIGFWQVAPVLYSPIQPMVYVLVSCSAHEIDCWKLIPQGPSIQTFSGWQKHHSY